jgi:nucleotidyltransferase substrate binding protein (TIGR01987 family)
MALPDKKMAFESALKSLDSALSSPVTEDRDLAGIIKCFEFTFETGWKYLRALLEHQGIGSNTPRESIEQAYRAKMIDAEIVWLALMKDRNLTVHTYDRAFAEAMVERIRNTYFPEFQKLATR